MVDALKKKQTITSTTSLRLGTFRLARLFPDRPLGSFDMNSPFFPYTSSVVGFIVVVGMENNGISSLDNRFPAKSYEA